MLTSLFFLDNYGSVLLEKHFEEHVPRSLCTRFWEEVNSFRSPLEVPPVMQVANVFVFSLFKPVNATKDSASLILNTIKQTEDSSGHISAWGTGFGKATSGLWIISASNVEVQPLSVLDLLDSVYTMLERYLGQGFSSHALVENASTVMLLLDEMFDAGLPYTSESNQLTEMIDIPDMAHQLIASVSGKKSVSEKLPKSISSPYPWRKSGAKYLSNEIFIDVEEFLDVSFAPSGEVSSSFIYGKVHCTCLLSSNPELTLKIKSPEIVQNGGFHRCARVNNLSNGMSISFVPPDGKFNLIDYYIPGSKRFFPVSVSHSLTMESSTCKLKLTAHRVTVNMANLSDVKLIISLPKETLSSSSIPSIGKVQMNDRSKIVIWKIDKFNEKRADLEVSYSLPSGCENPQRPIIQVVFKLKNQTVSGIQLEDLIIRNVEYKAFKGIRYLTRSGNFFIRV